MTLTPLFESALVYACRAHAGQMRKGKKVPYVAHLLGVASLALEFGATETEAIGALLHDAAEDQGGEPRLADIRRHFGDEVAAIVEGCSDSLTTDPAAKAPWRQRKEAYIAGIAKKSASIRLVSCADKLHNAGDIFRDCQSRGLAAFAVFTGGVDGTLWYYSELVKAFRTSGTKKELVDALEQKVEQLKRLQHGG